MKKAVVLLTTFIFILGLNHALMGEKLPYKARRSYKTAEKTLNSIEYDINTIKKNGVNAKTSQLPLKMFDSKLSKFQKNFDKANKIAPGHPKLKELLVKRDQLKTIIDNLKNQAQNQKKSDNTEGGVKEINQLHEYCKKYSREYLLKISKGEELFSDNSSKEEVDKAFELLTEFDNDKENISQLITTVETKAAPKDKNQLMGYLDKRNCKNSYFKAECFFLLKESINNLQACKETNGEFLAKLIREKIGYLKSMHDFVFVKELNKIKKQVKELSSLKNETARKELQFINEELKPFENELEKRISGRTWDQSDKNSDLEAAHEWLCNHKDWGESDRYVVMGVTITGEWSVQKRNISGNPVMHGLPVKVAVKHKDDPEDILRVFSLTLRTPEKSGSKPEPPFDHATVGKSHFIMKSAVKNIW